MTGRAHRIDPLLTFVAQSLNSADEFLWQSSRFNVRILSALIEVATIQNVPG